jgi:hypothetical protein
MIVNGAAVIKTQVDLTVYVSLWLFCQSRYRAFDPCVYHDLYNAWLLISNLGVAFYMEFSPIKAER